MVASPHCQAPLTDFAGRAAVVQQRGFHLWGSIAPDGTVGTYTDPTEEGQVANACREATGGAWQITTTAREYRRLVEEGTALPLDDTAFSQIPAGVDPFTRRTVVQLRVFASGGSGLREWEMDANQSITVVAQDVCVKWLGPDGPDGTPMLDVLNRGAIERDLPRSGMVIDSFLNVAVERIETTAGCNSVALLTRHLSVPAETRGSIVIPAYAREVTIYQEPTSGTSSVMWTQTLGDPNGASGFLPLAAVPWIVGQRKTQPQIILPNASHLWTDLDNTGSRFFTLVFKVRP